jgi:hypothetical protein
MAAGSIQRSFLLELDEGGTVSLPAITGRIEHILTGEAASFTSLETMAAFVVRTLAARPDEPHGGHDGP